MLYIYPDKVGLGSLFVISGAALTTCHNDTSIVDCILLLSTVAFKSGDNAGHLVSRVVLSIWSSGARWLLILDNPFMILFANPCAFSAWVVNVLISDILSLAFLTWFKASISACVACWLSRSTYCSWSCSSFYIATLVIHLASTFSCNVYLSFTHFTLVKFSMLI